VENKGMKPGLSERFFAKCPNCKHKFEIFVEKIKYKSNGLKGFIKCPECGKQIKLEKKQNSNISGDLIRSQKGNLIRRNQKPKRRRERK
jgi:uncharacterized Zn finger protein